MKNLNISLLFTLACALLPWAPLPGNAAVITSFETSEGFHEGSIARDAGSPAAQWIFNNSGNGASISSAYASAGSLSLALTYVNNPITAKRTYTTGDSPYTFSYSFLNPEAAYASTVVTSWAYLFLVDAGGTTRNIQISTRFGTAGNVNQIMYYTWDAGGTLVKTTANLSSTQLNFSNWNTLSIAPNYTGNTYTINLNGVAVVSDIAMPSTWKVSSISEIWLVNGVAKNSSGAYTSTYYDNVSVSVPEPVTSTAALELGLLAGGYFGVRKWQRRSKAADSALTPNLR